MRSSGHVDEESSIQQVVPDNETRLTFGWTLEQVFGVEVMLVG